MMKITRLVELSLYYKIKEVLSRDKTGDVAKSADFITYNLKYTNIETNYPVIVYVNGVQQTSGFTIDYINGIVKFATTLTSTDKVTVDYRYCPVNIYDEGKNPLSDDFKYPAIAIYEDENQKVPFELGSSNKEAHSLWIVDVWSERGGERNDITDSLTEIFDEHIEIVDYNIAFPTNQDGTKNSSFDKTSQTKGYMYADGINYSKGGSLDSADKPKFMSQIYVDLIFQG